MKRLTMALVLVLTAAGCSKPDDAPEAPTESAPAERTEEEKEQSAVGKVVDEVTGIRAAQQGLELKDKIGEIEAQRNRDIEDALGEEN